MTDEDIDIDAIEARASAASAGPWESALSASRHWMLILAHGGTADETRVARCADDDDAEFIAHARTDIPALIAEIRRLRQETR